MDALAYVAAGAASVAAGVVNALAGGGTLISFPTLVALGVPAINANVTNTVALLPGYLSGTYAQRSDLQPQVRRARGLVGFGAAGGLAGSVLLILTPESAFRAAVPYLILISCALLLAQDRIRAAVVRHAPDDGGEGQSPPLALGVAIFAAAVYGGFFGAGLGILLLALIELFTGEALVRVNALKQLLSFVINVVAAVFFCFSSHVSWGFVPVMAVAALVGGTVGGRLAQVIDGTVLRRVIVIAGVGVAISFWVG